MTDLYNLEASSNYLFGALQVLDKKNENFLMIGESTDVSAFLGSSVPKNVFEVEELDSKSIPVSWFPEKLRHGPRTGIIYGEGTLFFFGKTNVSGFSNLRKHVFSAITDALQKQGVNVKFDESSNQGNDLVYNGKKFCAFTALSDDVFGFFITFNAPYDLLEHYKPGKEKFEGKVADSAEERVIGLNEIDETVEKQKLVDDIKQNLTEMYDSGFSETEFPYPSEARQAGSENMIDESSVDWQD